MAGHDNRRANRQGHSQWGAGRRRERGDAAEPRSERYQNSITHPIYSQLKKMRAKTLFIIALSARVLPIASAEPASVQITNGWIREVPPAATDTAAYMKIRNLSQTPLQLVGGSSTIAGKVEPMVTTKQARSGHEVLGMETVTGLTIPGRGTLELKPGGDHLMIMGLLSHPKEGDQVKLTLKFSPGDQQIDLQIPVSKEPPK